MRRALAALPFAAALALSGPPALAGTAPEVDPPLRLRVEERLAAQRKLAAGRADTLFGPLDRAEPGAERDALAFLLAFAPLCDLAEMDGAYFLRVARTSLEARRAMPWGERVPSGLFFRYVLPPRVNTESLDGARWVLLEALRDRVRGLSLEEAVLEVNHFCHEHVTYRPSDLRTSAPLATMRTTWGRCGEESTLTVAALRAVGIPARQVYTPRWAHVDDNHAWVEVWVDGRWRYLGACEPEGRLDEAWFTEPARRAMLVHTKAFGGGLPSDETVVSTPWYDELNLTSRYAPTAQRTVKVVDRAGAPVAGARVELGLYNTAELYPLAELTTGPGGLVSLTTGKGDLRIRASKGTLTGTAVSRGSESGSVVVALAPLPRGERVVDLDLVPPVEPWPGPSTLTSSARAANGQRLMRENVVRAGTRATFPTRATSEALAVELGLPPAPVADLIGKSAGNHAAIEAFLRQASKESRTWALALLSSLSEKDLRDTPAEVLRDHLDGGLKTAGSLARTDRGLFVDGVLSPRIAHELLRPWRSVLQAALPALVPVRPGTGAETASRVEAIRRWVSRNVAVDAAANWYGVPISPRGVLELRVADSLSRDVLFVALCRAAGLPARLEPATRAPQAHTGRGWTTLSLAPGARRPGAPAQLTLTARGEELTYGVQFGLARLEEGRFTTLDLGERTLSGRWPPLAVEPGRYQLTTGRRLEDGSVLVRLRDFSLGPGEPRTVAVDVRADPTTFAALGKAPAPLAVTALDGTQRDLSPAAAPRGLVLAWIAPGAEPTSHALSDLVRLRRPLADWKGSVVLACDELPPAGTLALHELDLPDRTTLVLDPGGALRRRLGAALGRPDGDPLPVIVVVDPAGNVRLHSAGYRIGVGEQLLRTVRRLAREHPLPAEEE